MKILDKCQTAFSAAAGVVAGVMLFNIQLDWFYFWFFIGVSFLFMVLKWEIKDDKSR